LTLPHPRPPISGITVGGENVALPPGGVATIDTGSPFIGGPPDAVAAIYAKVPGARPLDGDLAGYYGFRMLVFLLAGSLLDIPFASQLAML